MALYTAKTDGDISYAYNHPLMTIKKGRFCRYSHSGDETEREIKSKCKSEPRGTRQPETQNSPEEPDAGTQSPVSEGINGRCHSQS